MRASIRAVRVYGWVIERSSCISMMYGSVPNNTRGVALLRRPRRGGAMSAERGDEGVGFGVGHIEAADEAGERRTAAIELEAALFERVHHSARHLEEELVGLDRCNEAQPGEATDAGGDPRGCRVRGLRELEPQTVRDIGRELGR